MYLLSDFEKAEIKGETLTAHFMGRQKAKIRLQFYSPALLQEVKDALKEQQNATSNKASSSSNAVFIRADNLTMIHYTGSLTGFDLLFLPAFSFSCIFGVVNYFVDEVLDYFIRNALGPDSR